ncbi:hypothetical protein [Saccharicrinis aurantiacus]|uniref:hypothetical protein n=1 Tax=Saccharicrinis aurantiacus TaxID=1849719 RepID=UPI002490F8CA|nr:hypothetical protein [Saccharicrinis aurantiacus]
MNSLTSTNVTFNFLKDSSEFLNLVLDNITTVVMLLNSKMELVAFNETIKTVFPYSKHKDLKYVDCGKALGCLSNIDRHKGCGNNASCGNCELRLSAINSYLENKPTHRKRIAKEVYSDDRTTKQIELVYSTRTFVFRGEKYLLLLIDPVN